MKITLLVSTFNSLSQLVYTYLCERGDIVDVVYANSASRDEEIESFSPEIILSPYLRDYIPKSIYENYPTYIFHPGPLGDRGAYSLENALGKKEWGVVILKANALFDGGDIYVQKNFEVRNTYKASLYRNEVLSSYASVLDLFFENVIANKKEQQDVSLALNKDPNYQIDWDNDTTEEIVKKVYTYDSFPGIEDEILGLKVRLYGAWKEERLRGNFPKEIVAKRDGAICLSTIDGAIWITHLKEETKFKLPATYVLKDRLKGVKEERLPLIFDKSYKTFYEISCNIKDEIAYLHFNFHNGAFSSDKCMKLKYAFEYIKTEAKVVVLMGGQDFFSNGIHLNLLEDSKKNGEDGWSNINAMNDLVKSILFADDVVTVASLHKNAGAGGVFLALACDYVIADEIVILNPHYKTLGLSGSEYHTYTLPKRVREEKAQELLDACLPIGAKEAERIGMVDKVFSHADYMDNLQRFCKKIVSNEDQCGDFLWEKEDYLEENKQLIEQARENEIAVMHSEFWDKESNFHKLRYEFVYKVCPLVTPKRLKIAAKKGREDA
ncbi:enoyl-CoA hydratase-related protein [Sulfurimonas paralvinellae]|uniref:Hydrogenase n=1 Tax=Sulfurimonas paralvinellae TaxID=317658 RepID=A0A7M1BAU1_9BACT|nr:enoyl-CoA hydratase-related protein [Sulfurimonas paralvinellae]QOP46785.1 hydrogenase [Sulfurimonas paralvinellae]